MKAGSNKTYSVLLILFLGIIIFSHQKVQSQYTLPYPPQSKLDTTYTGLQDPIFVALGYRALAADVAWIQFIQYIGGATFKNIPYSRDLKLTKSFALRVVGIDPYFKRAYLMASSILAYLRTVNRPEEALDVLEEGIKWNPDYWILQAYASGIGFKMTDQMDKMIDVLKITVRHPECPPQIKLNLARALKIEKRYAESLAILIQILDDPEAEGYHRKAELSFKEIQRAVTESQKN